MLPSALSVSLQWREVTIEFMLKIQRISDGWWLSPKQQTYTTCSKPQLMLQKTEEEETKSKDASKMGRLQFFKDNPTIVVINS